jgi:hypothetical protein
MGVRAFAGGMSSQLPYRENCQKTAGKQRENCVAGEFSIRGKPRVKPAFVSWWVRRERTYPATSRKKRRPFRLDDFVRRRAGLSPE